MIACTLQTIAASDITPVKPKVQKEYQLFAEEKARADQAGREAFQASIRNGNFLDEARNNATRAAESLLKEIIPGEKLSFAFADETEPINQENTPNQTLPGSSGK